MRPQRALVAAEGAAVPPWRDFNPGIDESLCIEQPYKTLNVS